MKKRIVVMTAKDIKFEVKPHQGLGPIEFGMSIADATSLLGTPTEMEEKIDCFDNPFTILTYEEIQTSLFFNGEARALDCIDTTNTACTLNGSKLFSLNLKQARKLMNNMGFNDIELEYLEDPVEKVMYSIDAGIELYFEKENLTSIMISSR
ncbi:MAG: hypothetical protein IJ760_02360 [Bacteroidales bacterium]|nr:hypothetical protein [Bacteroidales bacterium]